MDEGKLAQFAKSAQEAFVDTPLHKTFSLEGFNDEELSNLFFGAHTIDSYCKTCGRPTVFKFKNEKASHGQPEKKLRLVGTILREAECPRSGDGVFGSCGEKFIVVFFKHHDEIKKIGQMPSAADIDFALLNPSLRNQLSREDSRELGTAIGLNAHGVGVGSFVYLRRIFESLISSAEEKANQDPSWNHDVYENSRTVERVRLLEKYLPRRLVENSSLYSILSKGIHKLTEEECTAHFSLLYSSIVAILHEKAEEANFNEAVKNVNALASSLSDRDATKKTIPNEALKLSLARRTQP